LDGFFEGPNKEIDWHNVDAEFNDYAINFLKSLDALLFGRVTYELMAGYWPSQDALTNDPVVAGLMNGLQKIVCSHSLEKVDWNNSRLLKENIPEEIRKLKNQSGKDIAIFGSSDLSLTLIENDLIDEFSIFVNPVLLGNGKRLFRGLKSKVNLKLLSTKVFNSGNVLLCYQPLRKG
ncbi:MAG: dihydrofolate reductase family protein, partial [Chitinophagales bacterium]